MSIFDNAANAAAEAGKQAQNAANPPAQTVTTSSTVDAASAGASAGNVAAQGIKLTVSTTSSNLNIRNQPSTDGEIVGKAAHGESVTLVRKESDDWFVIRTDAGEEGYAASQYLTLE